jgi:hypothetical protein
MKTTLEKPHPTPAENLEEDGLPPITPEMQKLAGEARARLAAQKPQTLEEARAMVSPELRPRSPLKED